MDHDRRTKSRKSTGRSWRSTSANIRSADESSTAKMITTGLASRTRAHSGSHALPRSPCHPAPPRRPPSARLRAPQRGHHRRQQRRQRQAGQRHLFQRLRRKKTAITHSSKKTDTTLRNVTKLVCAHRHHGGEEEQRAQLSTGSGGSAQAAPRQRQRQSGHHQRGKKRAPEAERVAEDEPVEQRGRALARRGRCGQDGGWACGHLRHFPAQHRALGGRAATVRRARPAVLVPPAAHAGA